MSTGDAIGASPLMVRSTLQLRVLGNLEIAQPLFDLLGSISISFSARHTAPTYPIKVWARRLGALVFSLTIP